jgi:hypothetical protein
MSHLVRILPPFDALILIIKFFNSNSVRTNFIASATLCTMKFERYMDNTQLVISRNSNKYTTHYLFLHLRTELMRCPIFFLTLPICFIDGTPQVQGDVIK